MICLVISMVWDKKNYIIRSFWFAVSGLGCSMLGSAIFCVIAKLRVCYRVPECFMGSEFDKSALRNPHMH